MYSGSLWVVMETPHRCWSRVIDYDYRGNVGVVLFNLSKQKYEVKKGDRSAQLVLERIFTPPTCIVEMEALDDTERGAGGCGSTGK